MRVFLQTINVAFFLAALASLCPVSAQRTAAAGVTPEAAPKALQVNGVAASVNNKIITKNEVNDSVKARAMLLLRQMMDPSERESELKSIREKALEDLIERELVLSEYDRMGGRVRPQFIMEDIENIIRANFNGDRNLFLRELAKQGLSWTKFKELHEKRMIVGIMTQQNTAGLGYPSPQQKATFYQKNEEKFREDSRIKLRTIAIPKMADGGPVAQKKIADEIQRRVSTGGADFAGEARSYSADAKASSGGDWGWVPKEGVLAKELADVAFSLKKGAVSPVFEFRGLYYILYIEDKELGKLKPQAEIDDALEKAVMGEMRKDARVEWINKLKKKADIRIYP